jgi:hypothetical protein
VRARRGGGVAAVALLGAGPPVLDGHGRLGAGRPSPQLGAAGGWAYPGTHGRDATRPARPPGLGASNVCELEGTSPDDALLGQLTAAASKAAAQPPLRVVMFLSRLLTDSHPFVMRALMVGAAAVRGGAGGGGGRGGHCSPR